MADNASTFRARTSYAQPGTGLIGREDTAYAEDLAVAEITANPISAFTIKLNRKTARTVDVHWWDDEHQPFLDQINYGTGYADSATGLVVDNAAYWAVGDLVRVDGSDEVMLVTSTGSTYIGVVRDFGQSAEGWTAKKAAIADDAFLTRLANSFEPGHPLPTIRSTLDVEFKNYCQDHRTSLGITDITRVTRLRAVQDLALQRRKKAVEHLAEEEFKNVFGKPYAGDLGNYATANSNPATAGGINHYLEENTRAANLVDQADLTEWEFMDFMEAVFDKGNREKALFCPPKLRWGFDKWGITKQNTFETTTKLGMKIGMWQASEGDVMIITHDLLKANVAADWNYCFLLDMEHVALWFLNEIGSTSHDMFEEDNDQYLTKENWRTISCIEVRLFDYHGRLRFKTISL